VKQVLSKEGNMKKGLKSIKRIISNRYVLFGLRLILGGIFILAAVGKIPEAAKFVDVVTGYGILPWDLARAYGLVLPWLELTVGICLVTGLFPRLVAGISIVMIISFIVANGTAVYSYEDHIDYCGCIGVIGETYSILITTSDALVMDIVMMVIALIILFYGRGRWSLDTPIRTKLARFRDHRQEEAI
jgi:uncharacterized membrane protein YphA (DoxX/SURF4 family)